MITPEPLEAMSSHFDQAFSTWRSSCGQKIEGVQRIRVTEEITKKCSKIGQRWRLLRISPKWYGVITSNLHQRLSVSRAFCGHKIEGVTERSEKQ